ncbi:MAG TPA: 3-deoxy-D-manno-octulosonic acid transferase [Aliiroseovarius sp.]|nr:3-deoxy-D-manno-octulosonic acid transferase [Aliiroseovarius sp.]
MSVSSGPDALRIQKRRRGEAKALQRLQVARDNGSEHPSRWRERLGEDSRPRPDGALVWIHVGDEQTALDFVPLITRIRLDRDELSFLLTTHVFDPDEPLIKILPESCIHAYLPDQDCPGLEAFLNRWKPDVCLWADASLKTRIIEKTAEQDIPMFIVNVSMPDESQNKFRWFPGAARKALRPFQRMLTVDGRSARNLKKLGLSDSQIEVLGVVHEGPPPLECVQQERDDMAEQLAARPVWLAAGVSQAEEDHVLVSHRKVSRRSHRLLLILVPDDPSHGPDLAKRLVREGWVVGLRSDGQDIALDTQIYIADIEGEMGLWYRLAPISFLGQTMEPVTDRQSDPYEATALGSAVLHGPNLGAYAQHYARLHAAGAARQVHDEKSLTGELEYLSTPDKVAEMARAAWEVSTSGAEVSDRIISLITTALDDRGV